MKNETNYQSKGEFTAEMVGRIDCIIHIYPFSNLTGRLFVNKVTSSEMKVFISYCQENGGLDLAYNASEIIENTGRNRCWLYDRDKTPGADKYNEIKYQITQWCNVVTFLCTYGSATSLGQRDEIIFIREWRIPVIPIRIDGAMAPTSLSRDSFNYQDINRNSFGEEFKARIARQLKVIVDNQRTLEKSLIVKVK